MTDKLPDVKIYFGRLPHGTRTRDLDSWMAAWLPLNGFKIEATLGAIITTYCAKQYQRPEAFHSLNIGYMNFLDDDYAKRNVHFITDEGEDVLMGEDPVCLKKFECLGPGEILSDDARIFQDE